MSELIKYEVSLDVSHSGCEQQINLLKGDDRSIVLRITLMSGASRILLNPKTDMVIVRGLKQDNHVLFNSAQIGDDSVINYEITAQDTASAGDSVYGIQIFRTENDINRLLYTVGLMVHVGENIYEDSRVTSCSQYTALEECLMDVQRVLNLQNEILDQVEVKGEEAIGNINIAADGQKQSIEAVANGLKEAMNNAALGQIGAINNTALAQIEAINNTAVQQKDNMVTSLDNFTQLKMSNMDDHARQKIGDIQQTTTQCQENVARLTDQKLMDINNTAQAQIGAVNNTAISQIDAINATAQAQAKALELGALNMTCSVEGEYSVAFGENTVSGCRGYYIKSIDQTGKKVYLSDTKEEPVMSSADNTDSSFTTPKYEIGDSFSIINDLHYIKRATIKDISHNVVTYEGDLGFSTFVEDDRIFGHTFSVPTKPLVGAVVIFDGGFASGRETNACGYFAEASGRKTKAYDHYAHAEGYGSEAYYSGHAEGYFTVASGDSAHAEGCETLAGGCNSHAEGNGSEALGEFSHAEGVKTHAMSMSSHAEGNQTTAHGEYSHSEGNATKAVGSQSHAEGSKTQANGDSSHAEGVNTITRTSAAHAEGQDTEASATGSHAEGVGTVSSGPQSHAEGFQTTASGISAHAEGHYNVEAGGIGSHAEGQQCQAIGAVSHAEGESTKTDKNAYASHAEGQGTVTMNTGCHAEGYYTIARTSYSHVQGKFNIDDGSNKYAHIVGNGLNNSSRSNAHTLDWQGNAWYQGTVTSTGADYAEYFEWEDGNPDDEDRVGYLVTLSGDKIRKAAEGEEIIGAISGTVAILGDNYECEWNGKYMIDEFGRTIYQEEEVFQEQVVFDENGEPVVERKSLGMFKHPVINPDYDESVSYESRADRPEWDAVGMLGKLYVRDDGSCKVNGYACIGSEGRATASSEKNNMRVMERVSENVIKVLLR